jgi:hypothetical protein
VGTACPQCGNRGLEWRIRHGRRVAYCGHCAWDQPGDRYFARLASRKQGWPFPLLAGMLACAIVAALNTEPPGSASTSSLYLYSAVPQALGALLGFSIAVTALTAQSNHAAPLGPPIRFMLRSETALSLAVGYPLVICAGLALIPASCSELLRQTELDEYVMVVAASWIVIQTVHLCALVLESSKPSGIIRECLSRAKIDSVVRRTLSPRNMTWKGVPDRGDQEDVLTTVFATLKGAVKGEQWSEVCKGLVLIGGFFETLGDSMTVEEEKEHNRSGRGVMLEDFSRRLADSFPVGFEARFEVMIELWALVEMAPEAFLGHDFFASTSGPDVLRLASVPYRAKFEDQWAALSWTSLWAFVKVAREWDFAPGFRRIVRATLGSAEVKNLLRDAWKYLEPQDSGEDTSVVDERTSLAAFRADVGRLISELARPQE